MSRSNSKTSITLFNSKANTSALLVFEMALADNPDHHLALELSQFCASGRVLAAAFLDTALYDAI